ncbi:hypothetical protein [Streptomyces sp. GZWMJZ-114]|uniref:hypothetical protein n=1 Tax=Streptomyces sp. GZWMJZ-114 TaxID=2494734 RepID=UPI001F50C892|nr:hypothetical protein [Streptomyces sp. GZWMJZ-114]
MDYPADLLDFQRMISAVRTQRRRRLKELPYSVEAAPAWARPEGYWAGPRAYAESPGWTAEEQKEIADLLEEERRLAGEIITHAFWETVPATDRLKARDGLKHVISSAEPEAAAA